MDWKRKSKHFWWMMFELMNRYCRFPVYFCSTSSFSVQFSHSVMSDSLQPHGLQRTRLPCLSAAPRACSNSGPLSLWWHPTISSSVIRFSSCLQCFSHHQGLFQWVSSSHQVAKVLEVLRLCLRSCKVLSCVIRRHKISSEVSESQNHRSSKST